MASIDRFRSSEEVERLNDLKRGVDLVALATQRYGFHVDERSRNGDNFVLDNASTGEHLIVERGKQGFQVYFNQQNDRDKGTVVDFLQTRHPELNLGQIKGQLQELVPGAAQGLDYQRLENQAVGRGATASEERYQSLPPTERRALMVNETTGFRGQQGQPPLALTDSSYLQERGLTRETLNSPSFKGSVFTDQHPDRQMDRSGNAQNNVGFPFYNEKGIQSWELRNRPSQEGGDSFRMMMKAPKDENKGKNGVWSSRVTKGVQVERLEIGESPIDMMSKNQLQKSAANAEGNDLVNTRYIATGGPPSLEQKSIIQNLIDRDKPTTVVLSNDNDTAGQAFNVRALNDLRPPQDQLSPEQQQQAQLARERVNWIAGDNGKKGEDKLMTMTVRFNNEGSVNENGERITTGGARAGRQFVEDLREKVAARGLPAEEPTVADGTGVHMKRNTPEQTEVVLRVAPEQRDAVVDLARELRRDREATLPEVARTPEAYFIVEKANGKDYNYDVLQARAEQQLAEARERAGFTTEPAQRGPQLIAAPETAPLIERPVVAELPREAPQLWSERQTEAIKGSVQLQMNLLPANRAEAVVVGGADWNQLTVVVERGEAAETLRQALAGAGAKTELGIAGNSRAVNYLDGTIETATDYQVINVGYALAKNGGQPAEVQRVLAETQDRGQTLLINPYGANNLGGNYFLESLTKVNEQVAREERVFDLSVQPSPAAEYRPHPNGGGLVQTTAQVEDSVYVGPNARVAGTAELTGNVRVEDYALVAGAARLSDNVRVSHHAVVGEGATLTGDVHVTDSARVAHYATGQENAEIGGSARVGGRAAVGGQAYVGEQAEISGRAEVREEGRVIGFGKVGGETLVGGQTQVGEPNPPRPQFERIVLGEDLSGATNEQGVLIRDRLTAEQRTALTHSELVPAETRQALQAQVGVAPISEDAKSWATGFHVANILPPDHAGSAEKYVVLRLPTEEAAHQLRSQLVATGGENDVHVGPLIPVLRPNGLESDQELRIAYHLNGPNLPAVHEVIVAAQAAPDLVRSFERPLDALDRATEAERRPALEIESKEVEPVVVTERQRAVISVLDREALPEGVQQPDGRFTTLAVEVAGALQEAGVPVVSRVTSEPGPFVQTDLLIDYLPGSATHQAAQQVVADVQASASSRITVEGIEPAAEGRETGRYANELPIIDAPIGLLAQENSGVLRARLEAADLVYAEAGVQEKPGFVVLLDRGSAYEAAALEKIVTLHEAETGTPLVVLESAETRGERQSNLQAYYAPEAGVNPGPPELTGVVIVLDNYLETEQNYGKSTMDERLQNVGATVSRVEQTEAEKQVDAPDIHYRVEYPLDNAVVAGNVERLLVEAVATDELVIVSDTAFNRAARQELLVSQGEPRLDIEFLGRPELVSEPTTERDGQRPPTVEEEIETERVILRQELNKELAAEARADREADLVPDRQAGDLFPEPRTATGPIVADIDLNGSTSAEEILRADVNKDGIVTETELTQARYEVKETNQAQVEAAAALARQVEEQQAAEAEQQRQLSAARQREQESKNSESEQVVSVERSAALAVTLGTELDVIIGNRAEERTPEPVVATVLVQEAEGLHNGTIPPGNERFQPFGERVREALEEAGVHVTELSVRDPETGRRATELTFDYLPGAERNREVADVLRDALNQGGVQLTGIEAAEARDNQPTRLERLQALDQLPLAIAMREPQPELEATLRATGAEVIPEVVLGRPGLVVLVNENDGLQLAGVEKAIAEKPAGTLVVEEPGAGSVRQQALADFRERGELAPAAEVVPARVLPEARETEDRYVARPEAVPVPIAEPVVQSLVEKVATRETHPVERHLVVEIPARTGGLDLFIEDKLGKAGFQITDKQAVGEGNEASTRLQATYLTTDPVSVRAQQVAELKVLTGEANQNKGIVIYEPAGQAQERAEGLKNPGKPRADQLAEAGQTLRANLTISEADGGAERTGKIWKELQNSGARVGHILEKPQEVGATFSFPVNYIPLNNDRLPQINAILDGAGRAEGIQVTESENHRLERLARTGAKEAKTLTEQPTYVRPAGPEYAPNLPEAYTKLALTSEELRTDKGIRALKEEFKGTGVDVAVQHRDGQPMGGPTVTVSYLGAHPQREAVEEKLVAFAEKGGHVYDLKARAEFEPGREVTALVVPATPAQEQAALQEEIRLLEARREAIRAEQREANQLSGAANQQLEVARPAATLTSSGPEWVGFGPDLRGENLRDVDASNMDLRYANLAGQDLRKTEVMGSDLTGANLTNADLRGVNLTDTILTNAVFDGAQLEKAFRIVENADGRRVLEDNLTPAQLAGPPPEVVVVPQPEVAAGVSAQAQIEVAPAEPAREQAPAAVAAAQEAPGTVAAEISGSSPGGGVLYQPAGALVASEAVFSLPTEAELRKQEAAPELSPATVSVLTTSPELAPEPRVLSLPTEAEVTQAQAAPVTPAEPELSRYEQQEVAGKAEHVVSLAITQPVRAEGEATGDPVQQVLEKLQASGAQVGEERAGATVDESAQTVTQVLTLTYREDDKNLPAVHQALAEVAQVPSESTYQVVLTDPNAGGRGQAVEARPENTQEAAKALAAELHDGNPTTARLLVERPTLDDVWALERAGATVERVYLPEGPAAQVSYPLNEPGVTGAVSVELDRIDRDATATRLPHNTAEVSGPLLGENPAQQQERQALASAEGLEVAPRPRYEPGELGQANSRNHDYFREEAAAPVDLLEGRLAGGKAWQGNAADVAQLPEPDQQALRDSWKQEKSTVLLVVEEAPALSVPGQAAEARYPERVAEALREAGITNVLVTAGEISPDTGLQRTSIVAEFPNDSAQLAKIQATLRGLNEQDGVQVQPDGFWQRETLLGKEGSKEAEPALAERHRPWLEAAVAVTEPTVAERRDLVKAGARVEELEVAGQKPLVVAYYDLDNPVSVARVSLALDQAGKEGRVIGEPAEAREARTGRTEQYQADQQLGQQQNGREGQATAETAEKTTFAERLRQAVKEHLSAFEQGWDAAAPEKLAIARAEQRGIADRLNAEQKALEKEAYDRGFKGPEVAGKDAVAGQAGSGAEVFTEKTLRDRRDDERTQPVIPGAPAEGKVLETTQEVKPGIAAQPNTPVEKVAGAEKTQEGEKGPAAPAQEGKATPPPAEVTAAQPETQLQKPEWQRGLVLVGHKEATETAPASPASERGEVMRDYLLGRGFNVGAVLPAPAGETAPTAVPFSFNPEQHDLAKVTATLNKIQEAPNIRVLEEPHLMQHPDLKPSAQQVPMQHWPEREGQYNVAHIVVDDDQTHKGRGTAERIKEDLKHDGAAVGEVKSDGHGHVEMNVTYNTHTPGIEKINATLDGAALLNGVEVRESDQNRGARYQGAADRSQGRQNDQEQERDR